MIIKAQALLNEGATLNAVSKTLKLSVHTLERWLKEIANKSNEMQSDNRTHEQKVEDFLEQMKRDQEDIIRLAAQRVKETIAEANGQVANNILNTTTNNYRVSVGKANEIVEVRDWASFLEELEKKK